MQIILSAADIKEAVLNAVSQNINVAGKHVEITFTSGRSRNDLTANVVIGNKAPVPEVPAFNDDDDKALKLVEQPEAAKSEQTLGDPVQEAEAHIPATTGSLFKAPGA